MKEGFDKEIDSVLRRHARVAAGAGVPASHLDADELSAFAEGALPAAARVAVISHLADCDECRGIAVGIARASGFEVVTEKRAAAAGSEAPGAAGWGAWLSSLFAPRVLRYAVPALALCLVGVVSFVAVRSRRDAAPSATQTARNESRQPETQNLSSAAAPANTAANMNASAGANANANTDGLLARAAEDRVSAPIISSPAASAGPGAGQGGGSAPVPVAPVGVATELAPPPPPAPKSADATDAPAAKAAGEERQAERAENSAAKADENKHKAGREAETVEVVTSDQVAQQRRAGQSRVNEVQMPDGSRNRAANNVQSNTSGGGFSAPSPRAEDRDSAATRGPAARRGRSSGSLGERSDGEAMRAGDTRAAGGHRFRREGGAWVDVNYKPSMRSTGVRRGTEAFRALVADLPEIGRVAEQIGGEVVVVVRGRAYRIQ